MANGIDVNVAISGTGPAVLLLHGFPHTWELWTAVIPRLARHHRVIAPDLRGLGRTTRTTDGYDAGMLASDAEALLDSLDEPTASVVGIDLGAPPAFLLAMRRPERVRRLVLMEAVLGTLPGAEKFLDTGPPWWFGFHAVPELAETVLVGHETEYIDWFLTTGTRGDGIPPQIRERFLAAYAGREALRAAFAHYRAMPVSARQIADAARGRLTMPTMAIGAHPVGRNLARQLRPIADELTEHLIDDCGHIIPLDRPNTLIPLLSAFLTETRTSGEQTRST
ncbi:alpha/beta fold hydrolase [Amycolatopsis oliviviridis]|nr:alpha/beta hydrolase [Amycolatopsis oliviviridis]